jgi:hypothetical protein
LRVIEASRSILLLSGARAGNSRIRVPPPHATLEARQPAVKAMAFSHDCALGVCSI